MPHYTVPPQYGSLNIVNELPNLGAGASEDYHLHLRNVVGYNNVITNATIQTTSLSNATALVISNVTSNATSVSFLASGGANATTYALTLTATTPGQVFVVPFQLAVNRTLPTWNIISNTSIVGATYNLIVVNTTSAVTSGYIGTDASLNITVDAAAGVDATYVANAVNMVLANAVAALELQIATNVVSVAELTANVSALTIAIANVNNSLSASYVLTTSLANLASQAFVTNAINAIPPTSVPVQSVAGRIGNVVLSVTDVANAASIPYVGTYVSAALAPYATTASLANLATTTALTSVASNATTNAVTLALANVATSLGSYATTSSLALANVANATHANTSTFATNAGSANSATSANTVVTITAAQIDAALGFTPVNNAAVGAVSGLATLDSTGHLTTGQIPSSLIGALNYQGTWDAYLNVPTLVSGSGTKGYYYQVANAGSTSINGISTWNLGDLIAYQGLGWEKIDGVAAEVISVAGRTGVITLSVTDVANAASTTYVGTYVTGALAPYATTSSLALANVANATYATSAGQANSAIVANTVNSITSIQVTTALGFNPGTSNVVLNATTVVAALGFNPGTSNGVSVPVQSVAGRIGNVVLSVTDVANAVSNATLATYASQTYVGTYVTGALAPYATTSSLASYALNSSLANFVTTSTLVSIASNATTNAITLALANVATSLGSYVKTTTLGSYLPISGGTLTGNLTGYGTIELAQGANAPTTMILQTYSDVGSNAINQILGMKTLGLTQYNSWELVLGDNSNVNTNQQNFVIGRAAYLSNSWVDYPLTIYGSNGVAFFPNPVSFGSTITTPTQANTDNTTNVATTAFVQNAVSTINTNLFNNYATISYANQFVNPNWGATFTASLQFQSSPIQLIGSDLYSGCGGSIISLDNGASNQQFMFANSTDGGYTSNHTWWGFGTNSYEDGVAGNLYLTKFDNIGNLSNAVIFNRLNGVTTFANTIVTVNQPVTDNSTNVATTAFVANYVTAHTPNTGTANSVALTIGTLVASTSTTAITPGSNTEIIIMCNAVSTYSIANGSQDRQKLLLCFVQNTAGSQTVTLGTGFRFGTTITGFTASTTANAMDYVGVEFSTVKGGWNVIAQSNGY